MDVFLALKAKIASDSHCQILKGGCIIEVDLTNLRSHVLIEVVGPVSQNFAYFDFNGGDVLKYDFPKTSLELDFNEVLALAKRLQGSLGSHLSKIIQIVIDEDKLSLHFFNQKDYIRS